MMTFLAYFLVHDDRKSFDISSKIWCVILINKIQDGEVCGTSRQSDAHISEDDVHQEENIHNHDVRTTAATDSCHANLSIGTTRSVLKSSLPRIIDYSKLGRLATRSRTV